MLFCHFYLMRATCKVQTDAGKSNAPVHPLVTKPFMKGACLVLKMNTFTSK